MIRVVSRCCLAAVALLFCCSPGPSETPAIQVRIGFNTWVGYGPLYIAERRGFFAERGLDVDLQILEGTGERRAALIAGRLEGAGSTIDDLILSTGQAVPVEMVLALDESAGADGILVAEGIRSISDLRGRRIAVQPGFVNHFFLLYLLHKHNLSSEDVEIVPMEPDPAAAAFANGSVDVAVTWEPHLSEFRKQRPDGKVLVRSGKNPEDSDVILKGENCQGLIVDILVFRQAFIKEYPDAVSKIVDAWYQAVDFYFQNRDLATQIIADDMVNGDSSLAAEMLSGVKFLDAKANKEYYATNSPTNVFEIARAAAQIWQEEGYIDSMPDPKQVINEDFIEGKVK